MKKKVLITCAVVLGVLLVTGIWNSFVAWLQVGLIGGYQLAI